MDWEGIGLGERTVAWLEATSAGHYIRERRLDPFATSMRDLDDVAEQLSQIDAGKELVHSDQKQRMTDLRSASLVEGTHEKAQLTTLGKAVLAAWKQYGVATNSKDDELARALLLLIAARSLKVAVYEDFTGYWAELRGSFPALNLIHSWDTLYLLNYLDRDIDGYAPGSAYRDMGVAVEDIKFDLDTFAERVGANGNVKLGVERLRKAIAGKVPRGRARATFCIAMELIAETDVTPRLLLETLGQPRVPRKWVALNQDQISKIEQILADNGLKPKLGVGPIGLRKVAAAAAAISASTPKKLPYVLPDEIDFAAALEELPQPAKKLGKGKGKAPKKIDYKQKQEANDLVGKLGEEYAFRYEEWRLRDHDELRKKISRVADVDDTLGYDIRSWETDGSERLVEVKATQGPLETRFFLSANELSCSKLNPESFVILRVGNLKTVAKFCEIRSPLDDLEIEPALYSVKFKSK